MNKVVIVGAALALALAGAAANAATLVATNVVDVVKGATGPNAPAGRDDPGAALGDLDGRFYSLGVGGFIVLSFDNAFVSQATVFEVTLGCATTQPGGRGCGLFPESVEVYVGRNWTAGAGDVNDLKAHFGPAQGEVFNNASGANTLKFDAGVWQQLALVDTTGDNFGADVDSGFNAPLADGFDVDAVRVAPVPLPAPLGFLAAGIAAIMVTGRRKAS